MLTELEKKILASIQDDLPLTKRPYLEISKNLGISEETFLAKLRELCDRGVIRRFGATLRHQKSGFTANAMVAWIVDEDVVDSVGEKMASFSEVTHCYRRNPNKKWPYNLYTMIHAANEDACMDIAGKLSAATSIVSYSILFSRRELKKTSMKYFPSKQ